MWTREKLQEIVERRQKAKEPFNAVDDAALAYARWQGLTEESDVDRESAKSELDRLVDTIEPEQWRRLNELTGDVDEGIIRGLMSYSMRRAYEQLGQQREEVREMKDWPVAPDESPAPKGPDRRRSRGRSR